MTTTQHRTTQPRAAEPDAANTAEGLTVDGVAYSLPEEFETATLLTALRDSFGVTSPKEACGTGVCGACTVLVDGRPVTSCTMLAGDADGCEVMTAAGVAAGEGADVARCLVAAGGVQCGFCSPGFVVSITALLAREPLITDERARLALAGNLCRCTGYGRILAAVRMTQDERG